MIELYILLAILISVINLVPAFMPPTWTVLTFFYITFDLSLASTVIIGALATTLGRIGIAYIARTTFQPHLPQPIKSNYASLNQLIHKKRIMSILLLVVFAFLPIPSNLVYITLGLSQISLKFFNFAFFAGRIILYATVLTLNHTLSDSLDAIFLNHLRNPGIIVGELLGLSLLYLLSQVDWRRFK